VKSTQRSIRIPGHYCTGIRAIESDTHPYPVFNEPCRPLRASRVRWLSPLIPGGVPRAVPARRWKGV